MTQEGEYAEQRSRESDVGSGETLASASGSQVHLWDAVTGREIAVLSGHAEDVLCVAFSPDGAMLASGSDDTTVRLWNVSSGQLMEQ